jgi:hypothetical protein
VSLELQAFRLSCAPHLFYRHSAASACTLLRPMSTCFGGRGAAVRQPMMESQTGRQRSYRHRLGLADGYSPYEDVERRLAALPAITAPTITLDGKADAVVPANDGRSSASKFSGSCSHRVVEDAARPSSLGRG